MKVQLPAKPEWTAKTCKMAMSLVAGITILIAGVIIVNRYVSPQTENPQPVAIIPPEGQNLPSFIMPNQPTDYLQNMLYTPLPRLVEGRTFWYRLRLEQTPVDIPFTPWPPRRGGMALTAKIPYPILAVKRENIGQLPIEPLENSLKILDDLPFGRATGVAVGSFVYNVAGDTRSYDVFFPVATVDTQYLIRTVPQGGNKPPLVVKMNMLDEGQKPGDMFIVQQPIMGFSTDMAKPDSFIPIDTARRLAEVKQRIRPVYNLPVLFKYNSHTGNVLCLLTITYESNGPVSRMDMIPIDDPSNSASISIRNEHTEEVSGNKAIIALFPDALHAWVKASQSCGVHGRRLRELVRDYIQLVE